MTVVEWIDLFTRPEYSFIIVDSLNYCIENKNLEIYAWVIMSNHVHLVCRVDEPFRMSDVLRDFKKFTSKAIVKRLKEINESRAAWLLDKFSFIARKTGRAEYYKVWYDDNHAIEIGDYIDIEQKVNYIHQNPVKSSIVYNEEDYYFSSAVDYAGGKGLVEICRY